MQMNKHADVGASTLLIFQIFVTRHLDISQFCECPSYAFDSSLRTELIAGSKIVVCPSALSHQSLGLLWTEAHGQARESRFEHFLYICNQRGYTSRDDLLAIAAMQFGWRPVQCWPSDHFLLKSQPRKQEYATRPRSASPTLLLLPLASNEGLAASAGCGWLAQLVPQPRNFAWCKQYSVHSLFSAEEALRAREAQKKHYRKEPADWAAMADDAPSVPVSNLPGAHGPSLCFLAVTHREICVQRYSHSLFAVATFYL